jgi:flagellar biogenesis protein FliO
MNRPDKGMAGAPGGLAGWLLARWRGRAGTERRLILIERISLGPRQSLCLVKADGRSLLVANSADGASFYPLEGNGSRRGGDMGLARTRGRVSW